MAFFLGLDSSTQSLSALVVDTASGQVALDLSVNFGQELPEYDSPTGFLSSADPKLKHANPLLWVAAIDRLFEKISATGFDLAQVRGVSGAGQQHGTVYLGTPISEAAPWSGSQSLVEQVRPLLSRATAPIWMDSSTSRECREIADAVGGDSSMVTLTGSRAIERFSGPQIRKFWREEPAVYEKTREITLVSAFIASILCGASVPIDHGDGAGMNLLELRTGAWSEQLLAATAPGLGQKLRAPIPSQTHVGEVAQYFVDKYGFGAGTPVFAFTGDNPSSLVGMGATEPGTAVISLGTSDTVFAAMREPRTDPKGYGHVFGNPAGGFMSLICFANGSLAREAVREKIGFSWPAVEHALLTQSEPGNRGNLMLPFFVPEMTPKVSEPHVELEGGAEFLAYRDAPANARAVVEAQALSMQEHSRWIGERPSIIRVTGGAAKNRGIRQILADVFQAEIRSLTVANSSGLGGALRAAQAVSGVPWAELYARFVSPAGAESVQPGASTASAYESLRSRLVDKLSQF